VDPEQRGAGDGSYERAQNGPQRPRIERAELERLVAIRRHRAGCVEQVDSHRRQSQGAENADSLRGQSPERKSQSMGRCRVDPLEIVDCDDRRFTLGLAPQGREDGFTPSDGTLLVLDGDVELDSLEQIDECPEDERHLLLGRPGLEHPKPGPPASLDPCPPERRLADPWLADDHEHPGTALDRTDESVDPGQLRVPADDGRDARRGVCPAGHAIRRRPATGFRLRPGARARCAIGWRACGRSGSDAPPRLRRS